jgi:hypothetical protein
MCPLRFLVALLSLLLLLASVFTLLHGGELSVSAKKDRSWVRKRSLRCAS